MASYCLTIYRIDTYMSMLNVDQYMWNSHQHQSHLLDKQQISLGAIETVNYYGNLRNLIPWWKDEAHALAAYMMYSIPD